MAKPNSDYWEQRALALEAAQHNNAGAFAAEWQREYDRATVRIQRDIEAWYQRVADNNEVSLADAKRMIDAKELKELRWSLEEFKQKAEENGDPRWEKELVNASARQHISWLEREKIVLDQEVSAIFSGKREKVAAFLGEAYTQAHDRSAFDIQVGTGTGQPLRAIDATSIEKALNKPWTPDGKTFSDRIWGNQERLKAELQTGLVQGLIRGDNPHEIAKALSDTLGVSRANAARLVYTESAYFSELGILESYREHGIDRLEILATLDSVTCTACGSLDGKVLDLKDAQIGVTVPVFHPRCRCTTIPYYDDMDGIGQRIARSEDGKQYYVPPDTTYRQWKARQSLTPDEEGAILRYVSSGAFPLNAALRDGSALTEGQKKFKDDLNAAISKMPEYKGYANRELTFDSKEARGAFVAAHEVGAEVNYSAFSSFTALDEYHESPDARLYVYSRHGRDLRLMNPKEKEVLYQTDSKFLVKDAAFVDGAYVIELEEI